MNQQDFENVLISQLSGIAEMKNEREVWWQDGCLKVTVELADRTISGKVIVREYWKNGNVREEEVYPSGLQNNSEALAFYRDGSKHYKRMRVNGRNQNGGSEDYKCATFTERQYVKSNHLDAMKDILKNMSVVSHKLLDNSHPQIDTDLEMGSQVMSLAIDLGGCVGQLDGGIDYGQEEGVEEAVEGRELLELKRITETLWTVDMYESHDGDDIDQDLRDEIGRMGSSLADIMKDVLKTHPTISLSLFHY
jgi:hypothetical protein